MHQLVKRSAAQYSIIRFTSIYNIWRKKRVLYCANAKKQRPIANVSLYFVVVVAFISNIMSIYNNMYVAV